ncbi:MAG: SEL1-like repeat protein [Muribaculaceae bacterium]|nr:SEL1-like repeat protein [Muribaculaceae bacterium]
MKKFFAFVPVLALTVAAQAVSLDSSFTLSVDNAHKTSQAVLQASQRKADGLYESVRKAYAAGRISADGVVIKAIYHKVWSPELAARCLRLVADKNARAQAELGNLYTYYKTAYLFPNKSAEGVRLLESAARSGNKDAADYLGIYYNSKKNYDMAMKYFAQASPDNNAQALTVMGEMYEKGHGYKKNLAKAQECYRRASAMGYAGGMSKYGLTLQRAWFGDVNMPDAFAWLYIAGDLGDDFARSNLMLPLRGERFGDDTNTELTRRAFALTDAWNEKYGKPIQQTPLYIEGFKAGLKGHERDAESGDPWALFYIAGMSYNNEFLNRDDNLVYKCYDVLGRSNSLSAPLMAVVYERLADIYRNGRGVKANRAKADEYARMAAERGSLAAYKQVENIPD